MKQWFMMLSSREKTLVSVAAVLVPLLLLWLLLLQPMIQKHAVLNEQIQDRSEILNRMRQQNTEIKSLQKSGGGKKIVRRGNPQQNVDSALRTWRIRSKLVSMNAPTSKTVKVTLRDAEADNIMRFLFDVETKFGLTLKSFSMKPTKEVGKANASLTLEAL